MNELTGAGLAIIIGLIIGKVLKRFKIPAVTGYIIAGVLIGKSFLGLYSDAVIKELTPIVDFALIIIAFYIGGELRNSNIKGLGKPIFIITILQAIGAMIFVTIGTFILTGNFPLSLILGAIGTTTAPAVTYHIIREYKAKGPLTQTILAVVGLDDAVGIIIYGIVIGFSKTMVHHTGFSFTITFVFPIIEIIIALFLGLVGALILNFAIRKLVRYPIDVLAIAVGFLLLWGGILKIEWQHIITFMHLPKDIHFSSLLMSMTMGWYISNYSEKRNQIFTALEKIDMPIFIIFFVLAGAELDIKILLAQFVLAIVYFLSRGFGKISFSILGGLISKAPKKVTKYIGFALLPKAGVAIGLAIIASQKFAGIHTPLGDFGDIIITIIIGTTFINEIIGPFGTKFAIIKSKEAGKDRT